MSIADKITRLETAKTNIATAITAKGGIVDGRDGFEEFADDIGGIPEGIQVDEDYTVESGKLTSASIELDGDVVATIPDGVTEIGNKAFMGDKIINKVVMSNSVVSIENGVYKSPSSSSNAMAFGDCSNLKEIVFSNSLENIGAYAFYMCSSLTPIVIPEGVTSIGSNAFYGCTSLSSIVIPNGITSISHTTFGLCSSLSSVVIPESVTSIGDSTFYMCSSLNSVVIPNSVTSIGDTAFYNSSLTDIYYTGTQAQWESITFGTDAIPQSVTIHYEYTPES